MNKIREFNSNEKKLYFEIDRSNCRPIMGKFVNQIFDNIHKFERKYLISKYLHMLATFRDFKLIHSSIHSLNVVIES